MINCLRYLTPSLLLEYELQCVNKYFISINYGVNKSLDTSSPFYTV